MTVHREQIVERERDREKPTRCNNQTFIINFCLNMFRASLCPSSGEQRPCVTASGVLRWFCWVWLVAVVGRCVVGCEQLIINILLLYLVGFFSLSLFIISSLSSTSAIDGDGWSTPRPAALPREKLTPTGIRSLDRPP